MNLGTYNIRGGDYDQAGSASSSLKQRLKKIGVDPEIIRKVMIAAYEAETNVVIHAFNGQLTAVLDDGMVEVIVQDTGPGISDINLAMKEGYSTAPPEARKLGFGAGMGLPNIKKNSDRFHIDTQVGQGTTITFAVALKSSETTRSEKISVHIEPEKCIECLRCLHVCPTKALRIRNARPVIIDHSCINCTACISVCQAGALTLEGKQSSFIGTLLPRVRDNTVLVVPPSFFVQFGPGISPKMVSDALTKVGFHSIHVTAEWDDSLHDAVVDYAKKTSTDHPVISPVCPAIINLIEMRFPSLIKNLAPYNSSLETICEELENNHIVFVAACPCQYSEMATKRKPDMTDIIISGVLRSAILPHINFQESDEKLGNPADRIVNESPKKILQVTGIRHVLNILEETENGFMNDVEVLELYVCEQGCFGLPDRSEDPFIARHRWNHWWEKSRRQGSAKLRKSPYKPRPGIRLDHDMMKAIELLSRIDALTHKLPGRDCGLCGAPTCAALAEDVVLNRSTLRACVHLREQKNIPSIEDWDMLHE